MQSDRNDASLFFDHFSLGFDVESPCQQVSQKSNADDSKNIAHIYWQKPPVTARVDNGSLFAIVGGSQIGRRELLRQIARPSSMSSSLLSPDSKTTRTKGNLYIIAKRDVRVGYVTEQCALQPYLTLRETLVMAAKLKNVAKEVVALQRLHVTDDYSLADMATKRNFAETTADDIISYLNLQDHANSFVPWDKWVDSNEKNSGVLSSVELKLLNIAVQIINDPECKYLLCLLLHYKLWHSLAQIFF